MKNRLLLWNLAAVLSGIAAIAFFGIREGRLVPLQSGIAPPPFCISIKLDSTAANIAFVNLKVEGKTIPVKVDLGYSGYVSLSPHQLDKISDKSYLKTSKLYGIKGREREEEVYQIPEVQLSRLLFHKFPVSRENQLLQDEIVISRTPANTHSPPTHGTLGWKPFSNMILFLDVPNHRMAICTSLDKLKELGISLDSFTVTPLYLERNVVECDVLTTQGTQRALLDTGSTYNFINHEEASTLPKFEIGACDFGPITFQPLRMNLPIDVQMILGMEFFEQTQVVIDFRTHHLYLFPIAKES